MHSEPGNTSGQKLGSVKKKMDIQTCQGIQIKFKLI